MSSKEMIVTNVSSEINDFLSRRVTKVREHISNVLNINPFMLRALQELHSFKDIDTMSNFIFIAHLAAGHSTAFGKMIDEKVLPKVFNTIKLTAKQRRELNLIGPAFDDIDHLVTTHKGEYLLSLKASAWTIQHSQAVQLYNNFKSIGDFNLYRKGIVVGVFYGNTSLLTNKYSILRGINPRHQEAYVKLNYVDVKAGKEFWSWLNNDEPETQDWVMLGINKGANDYFRENPDAKSFIENGPKKLAEELSSKYDIPHNEEIDWFKLLHSINNYSVLDELDLEITE